MLNYALIHGKKLKTKNIPIIILTNLGDNPDDIQKAKDLGALDYLVKSQISLKELSDRVKKELGN